MRLYDFYYGAMWCLLCDYVIDLLFHEVGAGTLEEFFVAGTVCLGLAEWEDEFATGARLCCFDESFPEATGGARPAFAPVSCSHT